MMGNHLHLIPLLAGVLALGCGSSLKSVGDASDDGRDVAGDAHADAAPDTPDDAVTDIPPGCGDGDVDGDEECDDGNDVDGDGCDTDCTFSCHGDGECDDSDACTEDACDTTDHTCSHEEIVCSDGDPCTVDGCDPSTGCTFTDLPLWYRDGDEDGFGTPEDERCAESAPEGYVDNDDDCCDAYPVVRPDQTAWFVEPYACPGGPITHPTHDYNCDGTEERRYTSAGYCDSPSGGACMPHEGWLGDSIPACGASAPWLTGCTFDPTSGGCTPVSSRDQIQTCR
jgi:cysteine-rich repeat protein